MTEITEIHVLNGPNLGRLGSREPEVYGTGSYADLVAACVAAGREVGVEVVVRQSDDEATLIGWLHQAADAHAPVVLNAAALTHYSYALRDAVALHPDGVIEVHLSNIAAREEFRHVSVISPVVRGVITGLGVEGYRAAIRVLASR
jgi:3-dehydroquinate dehydratase-2